MSAVQSVLVVLQNLFMCTKTFRKIMEILLNEG